MCYVLLPSFLQGGNKTTRLSSFEILYLKWDHQIVLDLYSVVLQGSPFVSTHYRDIVNKNMWKRLQWRQPHANFGPEIIALNCARLYYIVRIKIMVTSFGKTGKSQGIWKFFINPSSLSNISSGTQKSKVRVVICSSLPMYRSWDLQNIICMSSLGVSPTGSLQRKTNMKTQTRLGSS